MKIDWQYIDKFLIGEAESDDLPVSCKEEIQKFLQIHDFSVFSDENLELLAGIWDLAYRDGYEAKTGAKSPNFFRSISVLGEENERETLSSGE